MGHTIAGIKIAEVISAEIVPRTAEDGLELLGNLYYQGFEGAILYAKDIVPDFFFGLRTKLAGDILQKFAQYGLPLAIVGDFTKFESGSLHDFILESN